MSKNKHIEKSLHEPLMQLQDLFQQAEAIINGLSHDDKDFLHEFRTNNVNISLINACSCGLAISDDLMGLNFDAIAVTNAVRIIETNPPTGYSADDIEKVVHRLTHSGVFEYLKDKRLIDDIGNVLAVRGTIHFLLDDANFCVIYSAQEEGYWHNEDGWGELDFSDWKAYQDYVYFTGDFDKQILPSLAPGDGACIPVSQLMTLASESHPCFNG